MKKLIVIVFLFSIFIGNAFSSETVKVKTTTSTRNDQILKNEAYLSFGTVSCIGLFGGMFFSIADSIADANRNSNSEEPFEAYSIGLGYNLFIWETLGLGGFLNFEKFGQLNLVSAQAKLTLQYGFEHFKFYHAASGGVLFISDSAISPVFDVTVIGLKLDFDDFNIFVEGCLPSTAFLKAGFAYYY